ncbi:hypothetical protein FS749_009852 [Ceratobasidium sp. UAMH 11750]|nr:hypothetical protein FS749_009852 [Ceratobasidium sp. UAMH 11750]
MTFIMGLKKLVTAVDPFTQGLLCLELSHATIGDNHLMWMAALSMVDEAFTSPDSSFTEEESSRLRQIINRRFNETINTPPNNIYILGSFGHPRMRNQRIYRTPNPLAPTIILPARDNALCTPNTSPCSYLPSSVWARIRKSAISLLKAELMMAETCPTHPLATYDAQQAKNEHNALLVQYACSAYPFDQPLGNQSVLDYWSSYLVCRDTKILGFIFTKLFSAMPNSMNDERTGSRMTFLFSKLCSRTDVNTMVEQIQIKQWYQMVDESVGNVKRTRKTRPVLKFRQLSTEKKSPAAPNPGEGAIPVALDDEEGDKWLDPESRTADTHINECRDLF